ncbi:RasGTPase-activating protein [Heterostelium album PN500]|uniref:RasGTPase-activating protein n=1 Tax=Heterostelium pallidum (strain ATCC 26659 / Pp 5 / PN500) TaxID=670386 RepID=D3BEZ9_HETP5|nr:RasGTPase-activating protein [Heterostelium album PN500]EFA80480.1 RasGTPase-activating protein [Heterostelium album PN500]|eukprot:XP_020432600.1 RasGTPase-activating protein [Heterostelium album PN500]
MNSLTLQQQPLIDLKDHQVELVEEPEQSPSVPLPSSLSSPDLEQQQQQQQQQLSDVVVVVGQDEVGSNSSNTNRQTTSFVSPPTSPHDNFLKQHKTRDCNIIVKVFEARGLPEARLRKKEQTKNNNNKSFKRAQSLLTEISSPNLMTFSDTTDPYCIVQLEKQKHRTRTIPKKLNPFWCEEFSLEVQDSSSEKLVVSIIDDKKYTNDEFIGKVIIPINTLKDQKERELWFPLQPPTSSKKVPQMQILIDFKPISLADPSIPGHISWKVLYGRNLMPSSSNGEKSGAEIGTPYINWSVRSKKGDIIIDEDGVSWYTALNTGVSRELTESIDCINFMLWRYEPKPLFTENSLLTQNSRSRSITSLDHLISKSPEKLRSQSSVGSQSPPTSGGSGSAGGASGMNSPAFSDTSSTCSLSSSGGGGNLSPTEGWEPVILGQGIVMASHIDTEKPSDIWLCLYPRQTAENRLGDVRLKLKYSEEVVLPVDSYTPLLELIQDPKMVGIQILGNISKQREAIANNLIRRQFACYQITGSLYEAGWTALFAQYDWSTHQKDLHIEEIVRDRSNQVGKRRRRQEEFKESVVMGQEDDTGHL